MNIRYKIFSELARRANNGELFNKNTTRNQKDALAVFFWRLANKIQLDFKYLIKEYFKEK